MPRHRLDTRMVGDPAHCFGQHKNGRIYESHAMKTIGLYAQAMMQKRGELPADIETLEMVFNGEGAVVVGRWQQGDDGAFRYIEAARYLLPEHSLPRRNDPRALPPPEEEQNDPETTIGKTVKRQKVI